MEVNVLNSTTGLASSNPAVLSFATDRLKEEHEQLRNQLKIFETTAKEVILMDDMKKSLRILNELSIQTTQFMSLLETHSDWEEGKLFPFLRAYFHQESTPTIQPSFWVLEKDHQLGVSFIQSFNEAVIKLTPLVIKKQIEETAAHLIQACLILNDHIAMEEQVIFPLTEKVLTDLESLFS